MAATITLPTGVCLPNGPELVGFSAGGDRAPPVSSYTYITRVADVGNVEAAAFALAKNIDRFHLSYDNTLDRIALAMMYVVSRHMLYAPLDANHADATVEETDAAEAPSAAAVTEVQARARELISDDSEQNGVLMSVIVKLNWWMMNHHIGQGVFAAFVRKALMFGGVKETDLVYGSPGAHALWAVAHAIDTRACMTWINIASQAIGNARPWTPVLNLAITREFALRYESPPAGSRASFNVANALSRLAKGPYALAANLQVAQELEAWYLVLDAFTGNRWSLHEGGRYLCGEKTTLAEVFSEDSRAIASAYVRIACPKSSLAKAKAGFVEVEGHACVATINAIRKILTRGLKIDEIEKALSKGQKTTGNPFSGIVPGAYEFNVSDSDEDSNSDSDDDSTDSDSDSDGKPAKKKKKSGKEKASGSKDKKEKKEKKKSKTSKKRSSKKEKKSKRKSGEASSSKVVKKKAKKRSRDEDDDEEKESDGMADPDEEEEEDKEKEAKKTRKE